MTDVQTEVTDAQAGVSRGQFIRNAAKGSLVLVGSGGVLASMDGIAFAKGSSLSKSDITVLQTGFIAETLAVTIYGAILKTYFAKLKLDPGNRSYFVAAYNDEKAHLAAWKAALGPKNIPTGFKLTVPGKYVASKNALAKTGMTLESAFVSTYLGAIDEFNSSELKTTAGSRCRQRGNALLVLRRDPAGSNRCVAGVRAQAAHRGRGSRSAEEPRLPVVTSVLPAGERKDRKSIRSPALRCGGPTFCGVTPSPVPAPSSRSRLG